ncbi:hypothetical protein NQ314_007209 [Rhamnusium bicolor]|uniref:MADF domain-containing protein n=1 Tax=Rhamnusium bicolor TaxID=1586634 RepID=A0AAV8YSH4_9CUCU|nr:hypothetical protein NQ314_007209 [Rhamnusium bicolor]
MKCLWNIKSEKYKNKQKRDAAYERLRETVTFLPNFTIQDVKNKIKNLRSTYYQELKKVKESMGTGTGTDYVYTPHVRWFDTLHVILQTVTPTRKTLSNVVSNINYDNY